jgi:hypothetical protein
MSARELFKRDVDIMPEDVFNVLEAMWMIAKERDMAEIPNEKTIAAMSETPTRRYESFNEYLKAIDEMDDIDEDV